MNPYDHAHGLAEALRNSDEFNALKEARLGISGDPEGASLLQSFRNKQIEVSSLQMQGKDVGEELERELHQLIAQFQDKPQLNRIIEAENRVGQLMNDIQGILSKPFEELESVK